MKRTLFILALVLAFFPLPSFGQEINQSLEDISGQYAECAVYYDLVYHAMKSSNKKEGAEAYLKLYYDAYLYSVILANQIREC